MPGSPSLVVGGAFNRADDSGDSYIARWGCAAGGGLGTPFCFGDGSGSACPCANSGAAGQGCANSTGQGGELHASGSVSVSAADLVLSVSNVAPGQPGLFFQGTLRANGGAGFVFGDGLRCAGGANRRLQVRSANASGQASTNVNIADLGAVSAGDTRTYQCWYRDNVGSPCGAGFNLTQGLELQWEP